MIPATDEKVLLIRPNFSYIYNQFSKAAKFQVFAPPTGLLYISAMLDTHGFDNYIIDAEIENFSEKDILDTIYGLNPAIVGFSATTPEIRYILHLSEKIKRQLPDVTIAVGGPHTIILPDEVIANPAVDVVCCGEGETAFSEYVKKKFNDDLNGGELSNIYYKYDSVIVKPSGVVTFEDVNAIPFQARDKINPHSYTYPAPKKGKVPFAIILSSRGCPYNCAFCCDVMGRKVRFMTAEKVVDEIEHIKSEFGIDFIQFNDDTFVVDRKRVMRICELLVEKKLDITWYCMARADLLDDELLKTMKHAGCVRITMGVESGNLKSLKLLDKKTNPGDYKRAFKLAHDNGIETRGSFIIGIPYETKDDIRATIKFAKELDLDEAAFNIMTPYPKTKIYEMAKKGEGIRLLSDNFDEYKRWGNAVIELPDITREELIRLQKHATRSFYFRPKAVLHQLRRMGFRDSVRAAFNYIPSLLR